VDQVQSAADLDRLRKLRENNKLVIGVAVKSSTSDLLIANCYHGFRSVNQLIEEARDRKLTDLDNDGKSGGYVVRAMQG
jgi:arginine/ornithine N-succinyltransferase beta subunit